MVNFPVRRSLVESFPHFLVIPAFLIGVAAILSGCHPAVTDPNDPKFIEAEKGTWKITREDLNKEVAVFLKQNHTTPDQVGPSKMPIVETVTLKNMVLKKLLLDQGAANPVKDADKAEAAEFDAIKTRIPPGKSLEELLKTAGLTVDDLKKQIHEKIIVENVLKAQAFKNVDPTEQQISDFYLQNKASITTPPQIRASRILVHLDEKMSPADKAAKKKIIDKAHARVLKGEEFSKVASQVSEDQSSKEKGGDLDFFRPNENEPGFDDVAFRTKLGAVSPVFETSLGYQFIKVTDAKPGGQVPLAEVRPKITAYLREKNMEEQSQAYAKKLLADSGVTYHMTLVDPPAQMPPGGPGGPGGPDNAPPSGPDGAPPAGPDNAPPSGVTDNGAPPAAPDGSAPPPAPPAPPAEAPPAPPPAPPAPPATPPSK
jgi:parvulin-like peptidyl-prolyl isomerase